MTRLRTSQSKIYAEIIADTPMSVKAYENIPKEIVNSNSRNHRKLKIIAGAASLGTYKYYDRRRRKLREARKDEH